MNNAEKIKNLKIKIGHLYPKEMNIYGDMGNIIALKRRLEWRNIDVEIININKGEIIEEDVICDIYFMGGGQDNDMFKVYDDMIKYKKSFIKNEVNNNKVFLLICGAYELFGKYFLDSSGRKIEGLDILPIETKAPGDALEDRCLGNLIYKINPEIQEDINKFYEEGHEDTIVGFENHSGQVVILDKEKIEPIGKVIYGKGNNSTEKIEGGNLKNIFGSFTHGSLLPKNPHFADLLIGKALKNKYDDIKLKPLDDEIEWKAHKAIRNKLLTQKNNHKYTS